MLQQMQSFISAIQGGTDPMALFNQITGSNPELAKQCLEQARKMAGEKGGGNSPEFQSSVKEWYKNNGVDLGHLT